MGNPVKNGQMNLMLFLATSGFHQGAWRRADSSAHELLSLDLLKRIAASAEEAKLDAVFMADGLGLDVGRRRQPRLFDLEPVTAMSAIAAVTSHIGVISTLSTTFNEPFNVARYMNSADHLSDGRVGWNIVTSTGGGQNFVRQMPPHDQRYAIAEEFVTVVKELWDSWDDDAVIDDRASGDWVVGEKVHPIDFHGQHFDVAGPALSPRSPQGWPVLVQAGQSADGIAFAARHAEVIFTAQNELELARAFYTAVHDALAASGRATDSVRILPGLMPIIGSSRDHAQEIADDLADLVDPVAALRYVSNFIADIDLGTLPLDEPIPLELLPDVDENEGNRSRYVLFHKRAVEERQTLRELMRLGARGAGHLVVIGTASDVADIMEEWFTGDACDGFNIGIPYIPAGLGTLTADLVPELQRRGLFRKEYESPTLRGHLDLERPAVSRRSATR